VLDISRYYLDAKLDDPTGTRLLMNWLPEQTSDSFEAGLLAAGRVSAGRYLGRERLARALCEAAGIEPTTACDQLSRPARKALVETVTALPLPITGDRGYITPMPK